MTGLYLVRAKKIASGDVEAHGTPPYNKVLCVRTGSGYDRVCCCREIEFDLNYSSLFSFFQYETFYFYF